MDDNRAGRLGPEQTQAVLRRAAELDREHASGRESTSLPSRDEPRIDAADLERIAAESGLSRESVQRALHEIGTRPPHASPGKRESVSAQQTFDHPPEVVEQQLFATMERNGLSPVHREEHVARWEPAFGLRHTLGRAFNVRGTAVWTGSTIESRVYAVAGQRASAELRGDARDLALPTTVVTGFLLAFPAGVALLVALAVGLRAGFSGQHALAALVVIAAWAVLTALISRGVRARRTSKLRSALERLLRELGDMAPSAPRRG